MSRHHTPHAYGIMEYERYEHTYSYSTIPYIAIKIRLTFLSLPVAAVFSLKTEREELSYGGIGRDRDYAQLILQQGEQVQRTFTLQQHGKFNIAIYQPKDTPGQPTHTCHYTIRKDRKYPVRVAFTHMTLQRREGINEENNPITIQRALQAQKKKWEERLYGTSSEQKREQYPEGSLFTLLEEDQEKI